MIRFQTPQWVGLKLDKWFSFLISTRLGEWFHRTTPQISRETWSPAFAAGKSNKLKCSVNSLYALEWLNPETEAIFLSWFSYATLYRTLLRRHTPRSRSKGKIEAEICTMKKGFSSNETTTNGWQTPIVVGGREFSETICPNGTKHSVLSFRLSAGGWPASQKWGMSFFSLLIIYLPFFALSFPQPAGHLGIFTKAQRDVSKYLLDWLLPFAYKKDCSSC